MAGFGDLVQKAFYLGVGIASYAGEKAGDTLKDVRGQSQKIVDELVARGEMTAEDAQRLVNEMVSRAQAGIAEPSTGGPVAEPRQIEILDDDVPATSAEAQQAEDLRRQVAALREELNRLKRQP